MLLVSCTKPHDTRNAASQYRGHEAMQYFSCKALRACMCCTSTDFLTLHKSAHMHLLCLCAAIRCLMQHSVSNRKLAAAVVLTCCCLTCHDMYCRSISLSSVCATMPPYWLQATHSYRTLPQSCRSVCSDGSGLKPVGNQCRSTGDTPHSY
jgi:hypothetical protein